MATRNLPWQSIGVVLTIFLFAGCVTPTPQVGDPERGREIFKTGGGVISENCVGCHTLDGSASPKAIIGGPSIQGVSERAGDRVPELSAEEYLRQSIVDPDAYIVEGFRDFMPKGLQFRLSEEDIDDLVAFMLTQ